MIIIGVTGSIGTGKTTVAGMFKSLGAVIFDADKIAHKALDKKRGQIAKAFGGRILDNQNNIDRKLLGKAAFKDKRSLKRLCGIVHPMVKKEVSLGLKAIKKRSPKAVVVLDIPLLIEAGYRGMVDFLVVVKAKEKQQIERVAKKTALTEKEIKARIRAQMPIGEKARLADFVIDNSGKKSSTKRGVKRIWREIAQAV